MEAERAPVPRGGSYSPLTRGVGRNYFSHELAEHLRTTTFGSVLHFFLPWKRRVVAGLYLCVAGPAGFIRYLNLFYHPSSFVMFAASAVALFTFALVFSYMTIVGHFDEISNLLAEPVELRDRTSTLVGRVYVVVVVVFEVWSILSDLPVWWHRSSDFNRMDRLCAALAYAWLLLLYLLLAGVLAIFARVSVGISWRHKRLAKRLEALLEEEEGDSSSKDVETFIQEYLDARLAIQRFNHTVTYAVFRVCACVLISFMVVIQKLCMVDWSSEYGQETISSLLPVLSVVPWLGQAFYSAAKASETGDMVYITGREVRIALELRQRECALLRSFEEHANDGALQICIYCLPVRFSCVGAPLYALTCAACLYAARRMHMDLDVEEVIGDLR
eukprot:TRINITY_DN76225_c0_g1_i1.p1 TRINITY_DN76225_c0_g1~~TRINITY_DN76225_c0_g1_i1.p1  ORF type:complete len:388 (-),score=13.59 TRINITY_DN76225_c0_g1_i1:4-1167(-)